MAAIAIAGVGLMVVCSSSLTAVMMMGGEEETSATTTTAGPSAPVLPEAQYVRVKRPSADYPGNIINLGELEVFDKAGTNIALNATVTGGPGPAHSAGPFNRLTDGNATGLM